MHQTILAVEWSKATEPVVWGSKEKLKNAEQIRNEDWELGLLHQACLKAEDNQAHLSSLESPGKRFRSEYYLYPPRVPKYVALSLANTLLRLFI